MKEKRSVNFFHHHSTFHSPRVGKRLQILGSNIFTRRIREAFMERKAYTNIFRKYLRNDKYLSTQRILKYAWPVLMLLWTAWMWLELKLNIVRCRLLRAKMICGLVAGYLSWRHQLTCVRQMLFVFCKFKGEKTC